MDSKKLNLALTIFKFALGILGLIACALVIVGPSGAGDIEKEVVEKFRDGGSMAFAVGFTGFIMIACIALILIFFVVQLISNPKKTIISIAGIIAMLVLYLVLSMLGTSDVPEDLKLQVAQPVSQSTVNSTTAGLWTAIIAIGVTILAALLGPVVTRFRK